MSAPVRLAAFAALLAVVLAGAAALGGAVDADAPGGEAGAASAGHSADGPAAASAEDGHAAAAPADDAGHAGAEHDPRGLAVADDGLRLVAERTRLARGSAQPFRFSIVDEQGRRVRDFDVEHERRMHVIVVRRDLTGYQHLHPRLRDDGAWETELRLGDAGVYRVFADFSRRGQAHTLGVDVTVPGDMAPRELPHPTSTASAGRGYEVSLAEDGDELSFTVRRDGREIEDVEPYLGARGHLVALRDGDLAYLHVHPESEATEGREIRFRVEYPSEGRYALFLQFKHDGRVHTAAFTREAGDEHGH